MYDLHTILMDNMAFTCHLISHIYDYILILFCIYIVFTIASIFLAFNIIMILINRKDDAGTTKSTG